MLDFTPFTEELAQELLKSSEEFPVEFDKAWQWLGLSRKDSAKRSFMKCKFLEGLDYKSFHVLVEREIGGSEVEMIQLTNDCFKHWAMMCQTEKGKEVRKYYLKCERIAKEKYKEINSQKPLTPGELLKLQAEAIIAVEQKTLQLEEEQTKLAIAQAQIERSQIELLEKHEVTSYIATEAKEEAQQAKEEAQQAKEQSKQVLDKLEKINDKISRLQEFILSTPDPLPQTIRQKLVEAIQLLGGLLEANGVYTGYEAYERPWRELGLAMRNSGSRYDLNARYSNEKRRFEEAYDSWVLQGRVRGRKPKKPSRPDVLERDGKLAEAYQGAKLLAQRYLSTVPSLT